jgi:methionyl-tRNA synthetase
MQEFFNQNPWVLLLLQIWTLPWKGLALWVAARRKDNKWFIIILVLQTVGLLEIIYLIFIAKYKFDFLRKIFKK